MTTRTIGQRLFTDGVTRPVYEDERGQFIASKLTVFGVQRQAVRHDAPRLEHGVLDVPDYRRGHRGRDRLGAGRLVFGMFRGQFPGRDLDRLA
jgi:hypothetical protein